MTVIHPAWTTFAQTPSVSSDADVHWLRFREGAERHQLTDAAGTVEDHAATRALLQSIFTHSPYLTRCLLLDLPFTFRLLCNGPDDAYESALDSAKYQVEPEPEAQLMDRLRVAKRQVAATIALADIVSAWPLDKVTGSLSLFAGTVLRTTCAALLGALHDKGELALQDRARPETGSGLFVLAMGKLGADELNYSSDIDLIVLFDQDVVPDTGKRGVQQIFTRLAQGLTRIIGSQTARGYVFRTDLRLRPDPGSTPPAISVRSAEIYYRESARNWERAAMIKARPIAGDIRAGDAFLETLQPFVWRRRLDFLAMQDIRTMKQKIDAARTTGDDPLKGHSVKLGRGGIREIEFFVQSQQLLWGGRDPELRNRRTLEMLLLLSRKGHVAYGTVLDLDAAYTFLRRLEHRLQMVNDQQTHSLPDSDDGLANIASFMGFESISALETELRKHIGLVEHHFSNLFADRIDVAQRELLVFPDDADDPETLTTLGNMGYGDPSRISGYVRNWAEARVPALKSDLARRDLQKLTPALLTAFANFADSDTVFARFNEFLARLPAGTELFPLLAAHPELFDLIGTIMGSAPRLATWLTRYPVLFDSLLAREFAELSLDDEDFEPEMKETVRRGLVRLFYLHELDKDEMRGQLDAAAATCRDLQDLLDIERRWANDKLFQIGVHILRGLLTPVEAGRPLSNIAEVCINKLVPSLEEEFAADHGRLPGGRFGVVAFGKLGSREMTVSSDLDLMFLYDCDSNATESNGRKPLSVIQYYARLCRRLIAAVSSPTAEGKLYDVDMRLRPSGNAGPIACSMETFERYQLNDAWTWEHQALTRARIIHAETGLREDFERVRNTVLGRSRDRNELAGAVNDMRERIRNENRSGSATIKHMPGGLLDIEFMAQYLQLLHAAHVPGIVAGHSIAVFEAAGNHDIIDKDTMQDLCEATTLWRNLQGTLRLTMENENISETARIPTGGLVHQLGGKVFAGALIETVHETAERVAGHYRSILDLSQD